MKLNLLITIPLTVILIDSSLAKADDYDRKAAAAAQAEGQVAAVKAHEIVLREVSRNNNSILRRIPRDATITQCFNEAALGLNDSWRLQTIEWNSVPVTSRSDGIYADPAYALEISECHYHVNRTGQDCAIYVNTRTRSNCY
jgi:hypothetical protein